MSGDHDHGAMGVLMVGIPTEVYAAFLVATLVITVVPGPDHVYLGAVALRDGCRAGIVAASGMAVSMTFHTLVAATGIGSVVLTVPAALVLIRLLGAGYLIYLGIVELLRPVAAEVPLAISTSRNFSRAVVVNLTNPKIVVFFVAFLPQFVRSGIGHPIGQLLVLGVSFVAIGFLIDALYAVLGGLIGHAVTNRGERSRLPAVISGCIYLALGALILISLIVEPFSADEAG